MGPIALKVLKEVRKAAQSNVIDLRAARQLREGLAAPSETHPDLPPNHAVWMDRFMLLANLGSALLGMRSMRKLSDRVDLAEETYMPGGPPSSPILDSMFTSWWMCDLTVGPRRESVSSILADIALPLGLDDAFIRPARLLAQSRLGVYRIKEVGEHRVELRELGGEQPVFATVPNDLTGRGELWLTRLLPPLLEADSDAVVWSTPYELQGISAEKEWLDYCARVTVSLSKEARRPRLAAHFKSADDPTRWLEYVMNAYAGVREDTGTIVLNGVPDRPETLPHHPDFDPVRANDPGGDASPLDRVRIRLARVSRELGFEGPSGAPDDAHFPDLHRLLSIAHGMYGWLDRRGQSALQTVLRDAKSLTPEERETLEALAAGWFSVFEVRHVKLDEGLELLDRLRNRTLWISERSATRQVDRGDLLAGWILVEPDRTTLEGAVCHVPAQLAEAYVAEMRERADALQRDRPKLGWKNLHGLLAAEAAPALERVFARVPLPALVDRDGRPLTISSAHYDILDLARAKRELAKRFESCGGDTYQLESQEPLGAHVEIRGRRLVVQCLSRESLSGARATLESALGSAIRARLESHQDPEPLVREAMRAKRETPPVTLTAESHAQIQSLLVERIRKWCDEPIPSLGGKTPRQAVRSNSGRDHVRHMLARQQHIFDQGAGLPPVDLREIWADLGLQAPE